MGETKSTGGGGEGDKVGTGTSGPGCLYRTTTRCFAQKGLRTLMHCNLDSTTSRTTEARRNRGAMFQQSGGGGAWVGRGAWVGLGAWGVKHLTDLPHIALPLGALPQRDIAQLLTPYQDRHKLPTASEPASTMSPGCGRHPGSTSRCWYDEKTSSLERRTQGMRGVLNATRSQHTHTHTHTTRANL